MLYHIILYYTILYYTTILLYDIILYYSFDCVPVCCYIFVVRFVCVFVVISLLLGLCVCCYIFMARFVCGC